MKVAIQRIYANPVLARAFQWGRLLTVTGLSQAFVQAVGFVSGILVIRLLPTNEYALYILANTMVGTMAVLADGGISMGVTAQGGKVWQDKNKLGAVVATGLDLRKKFGIVSLVIALPVMFFLLNSHGAPWWMSTLIILAIIPAFFSTLSAAMLQVAPKLQQDIFPLQKNQVAANLGRLVLLSASLVFLPFAFIAIFASSVPQIWANTKLKSISTAYADWNQKPDVAVRKEILKFVKRILPGSIYFCLSGQITIWLISLFGSTAAIAQVGALGRLAMVLSLFNIMVNLLVIPRFARLVSDKRLLFDWYSKVQLYLIFFGIIMVSLVWLFPEEVLWILGSNYSGLENELVLCFIGSCLNLAVGVNFALNTSRGWLLHPVIVISIGVAGIIAGILLVDVSTLRGVMLFNIFTGIVGLFIHPLFGLLKIMKLRTEV